jgi:hypothetical protein
VGKHRVDGCWLGTVCQGICSRVQYGYKQQQSITVFMQVCIGGKHQLHNHKPTADYLYNQLLTGGA